MLRVACDGTFLVPMRSSVRILLRHTSSSARASSSGARLCRPLPYFACTKGSRRMAEEHRSELPAREDSHDSAARPLATAAAAVGGTGGGGGVQQDGERFRVSESVNLVLHRGDITQWFVDGETDAIVNAANSRMLGGGGVDGAIHKKAGPKLMEACWEVPEVSPGVRCPVGEARTTPGFELPVSRVIHTVGPIYYEYDNPAGLLANAYRNSLKVATQNGIKYICFPAISCGIYSYPVGEAAAISLSVIKEESIGLSEVHFVMFNEQTYLWWMKEASELFEKM